MVPSIVVDSIPEAVFFKNNMKELINKFDDKSNGFINEIIIYNGTTINEGIRSNDEIDSKAVQLTKVIGKKRKFYMSG